MFLLQLRDKPAFIAP